MEHHLDLVHGVLIPYFNFALFVGAFVLFFRKPLAAMAAGRRNQFLQASQEAAKSLELAQTKFKEIKTKFDAIDSELKTFQQQSESLAKEEAQRLVAEGEKVAAQIVAETKRLASDEINRARLELRQEIVQAARSEAEKKIESGLAAGDKSKIMSNRLSDLNSYRV